MFGWLECLEELATEYGNVTSTSPVQKANFFLLCKMMQLSQSLCTLTFTSSYPFLDINLQLHSQAFQLQNVMLVSHSCSIKKKKNQTNPNTISVLVQTQSFSRNSVFCHVVFVISVPKNSCLQELSSLQLSFAYVKLRFLRQRNHTAGRHFSARSGENEWLIVNQIFIFLCQ